jgi:hypothetical protein
VWHGWLPVVVAGIVAVLSLVAVLVWRLSDGGPPSPSVDPPASSGPATTATPGAAATPGGASGAPAATAATATERFDATATRASLRRTAASHDWPRATDAFLALVDRDPASFHDPAIMSAARDLAAASIATGGETADRIFDALGERLGSDGPDILFDVARTRGGSRAATRAQEILHRSDVTARASPALRVTIALRDALCAEKPGLLEAAVKDGDARTVAVMQVVAASCVGKPKGLEDAQRALKQRLHLR